MINTGTNTDYASKMPELSDNADIQEALQAYHYGTIASTESDSTNFAAPSGFTDPDYGMVGKLKWIKTKIDALNGSTADGAFLNSLIDAKGDLVVGTAADTPAKLSAGTNGYVLQVDTSNLTYGLKWANLSDTHLPLTGGTLTGTLVVSRTDTAAGILLQGATAYNKFLTFRTGTSTRWILESDGTTESSTATGSDLNIKRYNNSGVFLGTALTITRSTGKVTIGAAGSTAGLELVASGPRIMSGAGTPLSVVSAPVGSLWLRTDGGTNTTLYVKESGTGNTGWVAK